MSARLSSKAVPRQGGASFRGYCNVQAPQSSLAETLSLADPRHRRDRAAAITLRLAAGVGSRVALPRNAAGRMGQAGLAQQTRSTVAQPGRVYGRPVVATKKNGGRNVSRPAFRRA